MLNHVQRIFNILQMNTQTLKTMFSSVRIDYPTPDDVYKQLNDEFDFTLDPCANLENAKCRNFYTAEQDGLSKKWTGKVYMNPPYGRDIGRWIAKAYRSVTQKECELVVALIPSRTDTRWWHDYVMKADEIRFVKGRIKFDGKNSAPFPSAIVIWRAQSC